MSEKALILTFHPSSDKVTRVVRCMRCDVDIAEMGGGKFDLDLAMEAAGRQRISAFPRLRKPHDIVTVHMKTGVVTEGVTDVGGYNN